MAKEAGKKQKNNYKHLHNNDTWSPHLRTLFFSKMLHHFRLVKGSPHPERSRGKLLSPFHRRTEIRSAWVVSLPLPIEHGQGWTENIGLHPLSPPAGTGDSWSPNAPPRQQELRPGHRFQSCTWTNHAEPLRYSRDEEWTTTPPSNAGTQGSYARQGHEAGKRMDFCQVSTKPPLQQQPLKYITSNPHLRAAEWVSDSTGEEAGQMDE